MSVEERLELEANTEDGLIGIRGESDQLFSSQ